jgi:hypothetical protein
VIVGGAFPYGARRAVAYGDGWVPRPRRPAYGPATVLITVFGVAEDRDLIQRYREEGAARLVFNLPAASADEVLPLLDPCASLIG